MNPQPDRLLTLQGPKNNSDITVTHFSGHEALSTDFTFTVVGMSERLLENTAWLGQTVAVNLQSSEQGERWFHGVVDSITKSDVDHAGYYQYTLILKPWFYELSKTQDCRIFQHQTALEILQHVCRELGHYDIDMSHLGNTYAPITYSVMFNESYHDYLQRLLANAGIYYAYQYQADKHVLTLYDNKSAFAAHATPLRMQANSTPHMQQWQEGFDGMGKFHYGGQTNSVQLTLCDAIMATMKNGTHKGPYIITSLTHDAEDVLHRASDAATSHRYHNQFSALADTADFTPEKIPPRPLNGPHTAIVTGPTDKKIYTNEFGQVKVHFHWDYRGKANEHSSCWLPVCQLQAGDRFGSQFIPRVGDEVIVDFLNGDINQPVVLGAAYNQENQPIYDATSATAVKSGIKTRLMNDAPGHELTFDDTPQQETLTLHSAGDHHINVHNDFYDMIGGDENIVLHADHLQALLHGEYGSQANSITLTVGNSSLTIDKNGISVNPGSQLHLLADGAPEKPAARVGDKHSCPKMHGDGTPHQHGPIKNGSPGVFINGIPAARVGDPIHCVNDTATIKTGADHILINNKPLAFLGSESDHNGKIVKSSQNVGLGAPQPITIPTSTTTPEKPLKQEDIAEVIYDVNDNSFYVLTLQQYQQLLDTADPLMAALHDLDQKVNAEVANTNQAQKAREQAIVAAKNVVNQHMKPLVNGPDDIQITELFHFIGQDPTRKNGKGKYPWLNRKMTYVSSEKMKNHWRTYRIDKDIAERSRVKKIKAFYEKMHDPVTGELSGKKLLHAAAKALNKKSTELSLGSASVSWGGAYKTFAKTVCNDNFQATGTAQLFRATAGGSINGTLDRKTGHCAFTADGSAEADLVNAQGSIKGFVPSREGFHLRLHLPDKQGKPRLIELGAVRGYMKVELSGFIGASVAAEVNVNLQLTKDEKQHQKIQVVGNNKPNPTTVYKYPAEKADADKNGLKGNVNAFVGAKVSGAVQSALSWQNPDTLAKQQPQIQQVTQGKPVHSLTSEQKVAVQQLQDDCWTEFASIDMGGSAALGAGAGLGFSVGFNLQEAKFYLRAHAEVVWGAGLSGDIGFVIEAWHIEEFVAFVYHKIKDQNFSFLGLFEPAAFEPFTNMLTRYIIEDIESLVSLAEKEMADIASWWRNLHISFDDTDILLKNAEQAASRINQNPADMLRYTLPEVKGRFLYLFTQPNLQAKIQHQAEILTSKMDYGTMYHQSDADNLAVAQAQEIQQAIVYILSYIQSQKDFDNVLQHMSYDGKKLNGADVAQRKQALYDGLGFYGRYQASKDPHVNALVQALRNEIIYSKAAPTKNTPVVQNQGVVQYA